MLEQTILDAVYPDLYLESFNCGSFGSLPLVLLCVFTYIPVSASEYTIFRKRREFCIASIRPVALLIDA